MTDLIDLVQSIISSGDITLYISGKVNGAVFLGSYTIKVIENKKIDMDKEKEKPEKDTKSKVQGGKS